MCISLENTNQEENEEGRNWSNTRCNIMLTMALINHKSRNKIHKRNVILGMR